MVDEIQLFQRPWQKSPIDRGGVSAERRKLQKMDECGFRAESRYVCFVEISFRISNPAASL